MPSGGSSDRCNLKPRLDIVTIVVKSWLHQLGEKHNMPSREVAQNYQSVILRCFCADTFGANLMDRPGMYAAKEKKIISFLNRRSKITSAPNIIFLKYNFYSFGPLLVS